MNTKLIYVIKKSNPEVKVELDWGSKSAPLSAFLSIRETTSRQMYIYIILTNESLGLVVA